MWWAIGCRYVPIVVLGFISGTWYFFFRIQSSPLIVHILPNEGSFLRTNAFEPTSLRPPESSSSLLELWWKTCFWPPSPHTRDCSPWASRCKRRKTPEKKKLYEHPLAISDASDGTRALPGAPPPPPPAANVSASIGELPTRYRSWGPLPGLAQSLKLHVGGGATATRRHRSLTEAVMLRWLLACLGRCSARRNNSAPSILF